VHVKRSVGDSINPFYLIIVIATVSGLVVGLNRVSVWLAPAMLVLSLAGIAWIVIRRRTESRFDAGKLTGVDHAALNRRSILPMAAWLKENVRGHDAAIDAMCADIDQNLALARPGRILGAYLLVGPTGTGKTFLAQLVGQALYPDKAPIVVRMNQYKNANDVFTLIGPPPGMPGYEVGGTLTRPVLEDPYQVVVFDEIEKGHPDLQHCLYDVLDVAATREKSSGKLVDFSGCVFFATCNAGVEELRSIYRSVSDPVVRLGRARDVLAAAGFEKAFLARWSGIYLMDELAPMHVAEVACLQLAKHWAEYGIQVEYAAPQLIVTAVQRNEGFRQYGVRQIATLLQSLTNQAIVEARRRGARRVRLGVKPDGSLAVEEVASQAQAQSLRP
jgi:ATP-dependent Clp protease ATP-binding subunit ClpC